MQSLQIMEGLIGTACALACLYYVRRGSLALQPRNANGTILSEAVPWHSALGEYARRNPFAAVFGALALGFLFSSWSMSVSPPGMALQQPRTVEKWHVVTKTVPVRLDPVQAAKLATLEQTINADNGMIASQKAEIDRLRLLLEKQTVPARSARSTRRRGVESMATAAGSTAASPPPTTAELNQRANATAVTPAANASVANPAPLQSREVATAPANAPTTASPAAPTPAPPGSTNTVPH